MNKPQSITLAVTFQLDWKNSKGVQKQFEGAADRANAVARALKDDISIAVLKRYGVKVSRITLSESIKDRKEPAK